VVLALAMDKVVTTSSPDLIADHWDGRDQPGEMCRAVLADAEEMLGEVLWLRLRTWIETG
jgi:hypothetical protein